jgi:hypothetical protein
MRNPAKNVISTLSQQGSLDLASHSQLPGSEEAKMTTAISGQNLIESYRLLNLHGSSLRTCLESLVLKGDWFSEICYLTWKIQVTSSKHFVLVLSASTPSTDGTEFGLFATPNTMESLKPKSEKALHKEMTEVKPGRSKPANLRDQVSNGHLWPTPSQTMHKGSSEGSLTRKSGKSRENDRLDHAVMAKQGGQLNADWVENLMGYPIGWTNKDCQKSAKEFLDELNGLNSSETQ